MFGGIVGYLVLGGGVLLVLLIAGVSLLLHARRVRARSARERRASWPRNGPHGTDQQPSPVAPPPRFTPTPIDSVRARQDPATIRAPLDGDIPPRPVRRPGPLFADDTTRRDHRDDR